jgi:hypothetical protein
VTDTAWATVFFQGVQPERQILVDATQRNRCGKEARQWPPNSSQKNQRNEPGQKAGRKMSEMVTAFR